MTLPLNNYMTTTLYKASNPFIFTILLGLSESSKITLFKDFIFEIIYIKVTENCKKKAFIIFPTYK